MKCDDVRLIYLADPREAGAAVRAHLDDCAECRAYAESAGQLQHQLQAVVDIPVPADLRARMRQVVTQSELAPRAPKRSPMWAGFALAASLILAVGVITIQFGTSPQVPLDRLVYEHVGHENLSLVRHTVTPEKTESVMRDFGLKMAVPGTITFVERCPIGDTYGLHLVYKNDSSSVTFIYLPEINVDQPQAFAYGGLHGVIRKAPTGSLAIVGDQNTDLEQTDVVLTQGIEWL